MKELLSPQDKEKPLPALAFVKMLGHLALHAYQHLPATRSNETPIFATIEKELVDSPQPVHPDIPTTVANIHRVLTNRKPLPPEPISIPDKLTRSARMVQFTDRLLDDSHKFFDYSTMKALKERFVDSAEQQGYPLDFSQQLDIALDTTNNDIDAALSSLWLSSRQYSRWLDSVSIRNLPNLSPEEIGAEIKQWRSTLLACKLADEKNFQDTAGDSYYAWTHARARVMFSDSTSASSQLGKFLFKHGTSINRHRIIRQSIPSDHRVAATYGNYIGDAIVDALKNN